MQRKVAHLASPWAARKVEDLVATKAEQRAEQSAHWTADLLGRQRAAYLVNCLVVHLVD